MLNNSNILKGSIVFILLFFITSSVLCQQETELQTMKIIEEIHRLETKMLEENQDLERNMRNHVDKKVGGLETIVNALDKEVSKINTKVANINTNMTWIIWIIAVTGAPIALSIYIPAIQKIINWMKIRNAAHKKTQDSFDDKPISSQERDPYIISENR